MIKCGYSFFSEPLLLVIQNVPKAEIHPPILPLVNPYVFQSTLPLTIHVQATQVLNVLFIVQRISVNPIRVLHVSYYVHHPRVWG